MAMKPAMAAAMHLILALSPEAGRFTTVSASLLRAVINTQRMRPSVVASSAIQEGLML